MIRAEFFQSNGYLSGFSISGHADTAKDGEPDIVCAAVSSAVQLIANGITEICKEQVLLDVKENLISLTKKEGLSQNGRCFLEALLLHLQLLCEDSPNAIKIIITEV